MDNSSRNIVSFIFVITAAALLIMGARYYAETQKTAPPPTTEAPGPASATTQALTPEAPSASEEKAEEPDVVYEDIQLITGEPSINLDIGNSADYPAPAPPADAIAAPEAAPPADLGSTGE